MYTGIIEIGRSVAPQAEVEAAAQSLGYFAEPGPLGVRVHVPGNDKEHAWQRASSFAARFNRRRLPQKVRKLSKALA